MNALSRLPNAAPDNARPWQDLGYDVGWEASGNGVIRCLSVRNRRSDIFDAVEGLNLRDIWCEAKARNVHALIADGLTIRQMAVRSPRPIGNDRLYMSAQPLAGGASTGIFTALRPEQDDGLRQQAALISKVSDARNREESYRREAEMMLRGLRLLLGEETAASKLDALSRLMVEAINGGANLLLREGTDGALRPLSESALPLQDSSASQIWRNQEGPVAVYGDGNPHLGRLHRMLGITQGEVTVTVLPVASQEIVLLCGAGVRRKFHAEDIGFANRFALILKQATALKEEQDKLIQTAKLSVLGLMSASLAHELRQPLNTIGMTVQNLELMVGKGAVPVDVLSSKLTRILGQVERASQIMDRVRRFSRRSTDQFAMTDIAPLVQGVRVMSEASLQAAGIMMVTDIAPGLGAPCDAVQIEQLLMNLVSNAQDAIKGVGGRQPSANGASNRTIAIRARHSEHGVTIRVEDSGPGFPESFLSQPLEAFFTTKGASAGTGLGLSICNTIAREHAGRLKFGNHANGAYVELHLPGQLP